MSRSLSYQQRQIMQLLTTKFPNFGKRMGVFLTKITLRSKFLSKDLINWQFVATHCLWHRLQRGRRDSRYYNPHSQVSSCASFLLLDYFCHFYVFESLVGCFLFNIYSSLHWLLGVVDFGTTTDQVCELCKYSYLSSVSSGDWYCCWLAWLCFTCDVMWLRMLLVNCIHN